MSDLKTLDAKLTELLEWYRAVNFPAVRATLEVAIPDTQKRVVYQLSTLGRSSADVAAAMKKLSGVQPVAPRSIIRWQGEWERLGLMRSVDRKRERIFDLVAFGIPIGADLKEEEAAEDSSGNDE